MLYLKQSQLERLSADKAAIQMRLERELQVVRDGRGRITGYVIQDGRVRNLRFSRVR